MLYESHQRKSLCNQDLGLVRICVNPDGMLIEILQLYLDRWGPFLG